MRKTASIAVAESAPTPWPRLRPVALSTFRCSAAATSAKVEPALSLSMIAVALAFLFPVYALVTLSLKDTQQIAAAPLSPPTAPTLDNFSEAWSRASLGSALLVLRRSDDHDLAV